MATQLLIYENVAPLSSVRHAAFSIEPKDNYRYSAKVNAVPLMSAEIPQAAAEYPLAFLQTGEAVTLVAILGLHRERNLYLDPDGHWQARYTPAFIRRYPFVFTQAPEDGKLVACIDESYGGLNNQGRGQRLFDEHAKPTPYVQEVLKFLADYQLQIQRTESFCRRLQSLGLLDPIQADIALKTGEKLELRGLLAVNRDKLRVLPADRLAELAGSDELELVYLLLYSLRNLAQLSERLSRMPRVGTAPAPTDKSGAEAEVALKGHESRKRGATATPSSNDIRTPARSQRDGRKR